MGGIGRRKNEDRLGEIELAGDGLHARVIQPFAVMDDGQRISSQSFLGENVENLIKTAGNSGFTHPSFSPRHFSGNQPEPVSSTIIFKHHIYRIQCEHSQFIGSVISKSGIFVQWLKCQSAKART
jgi:hypothetical protein